MIAFFKNVVSYFFNSNTFQKGAALAYYTVFSLFPIIIVITSILGLVFGKQAVSGEIFNQLKDVLGNEASLQIQEIIKNQHTNHNSVFTALLGFATLILSASGMFSQIHNAFNSIWNIKEKPKNSLIKYFTKHLLSFLILISLFFILIISTSINSFLLKHSNHLQDNYLLSYAFEHIISFLVTSVMFSIMFMYLGDAKIKLKPVIISGLFTSFLFLIGKYVISFYLSKSHISTTFGATSILVLIMLWVYYTSQIIFLGASFLKVLSDKLNLPILPNENSVKIVQQEIEHK
ncbi:MULTISPECIES: YihY/virulence factor BrkB family protein [unclassified Tenacibaculum]|uniref:YihY/virulence factor BrkB family protein n=1 Tax=unclassified Tenacibaculum TaxID=2635139 RepID=UPI001F1F76A9|nr:MULTISPECIES: YihY/virulence factor BrkB family protein [unclassified Tenacibaculum]MCF2875656.1 YihY/virulence factor BrkB family protein [Tenacibaculum sp. Cn5-1]MCF2935732.1 YihY/virulence factor BrkB family protein [Tenacibaculum sp. Cn5-34]MCG7512292.1 YihY/virulence factor BrkB family protein [Tenacibaculum sp. Cn5-46]